MTKMITYLHPLRARNKNNKGSSIVTVIVAMSLVCLLVSMILSLTMMNYQMKATDLQAKNSFYSAEAALEEINAGLQEEVSLAFAHAYGKVMQSYASTKESQRKSVFQTAYIEKLRGDLKDTDQSQYSLSNLETYLDKTKWDVTKGCGAKVSSVANGNAMNITTKGVTLKNLLVTYIDPKGLTSQIQTDLVLNFPTMDFNQNSGMPDLLNYTLIANHQLVTNGGLSTIIGSAYLGKAGAQLKTGITFQSMEPEEDKKGMLITNSGINITNGANVIMNNMETWAEDILVDSSDLTIKGTTHLKNDLMITNSQKVQSKNKIKIEGEYFGYGNIETALQASSLNNEIPNIQNHPSAYSSSIIVNGTNASVDLSGLQRMILAGNSYVGASTTDFNNPVTSQKNTDVMMGESLSVKRNQSAYLVPADCIAPKAESGGRNPMPAQQYQKLIQELEIMNQQGSKEELVDLSGVVSTKLGASLSSLGVSGWQVVCYPVSMGGVSTSMVYVFMNFDQTVEGVKVPNEKAANDFFQTYYGKAANLQKLQTGLDIYTDSIKLPASIQKDSENSKFYYNGNIVVNNKSEDKFYPGNLSTASGEELAEIKEMQINSQDSFYALGKKLVKEYNQLTDSEKAENQDVYGNLVKSFDSTNLDMHVNGKKIFISNESDPVGAILIKDNLYEIKSNIIKGKDSNGIAKDAKLRVVIATGDVKVSCDFEGLIIAKGDILLENADAKQIKANPIDTTKALLAANDKGIRAFDYLIGAQEYVIGGITQGAGTNSNVKISELITYENWSKQ
ncbi:MAG: hypothetical protein RSF88_05520 [Lachnospiraceae bacterium]